MNDTVSATRRSRLEIAWFGLGVVALVGISMAVNRAAILLTRPVWVDEVHTLLVARNRWPTEVIADLAHGADFGPPLYPLLAWGLRQVLGSLRPVTLHVMSLILVLTAVVLVFAVLRRRFSLTAAVAGALAVGTHSLVIEHSYEGRFYGMWLFCAALFALALSLDGERQSRGSTVLVAVSAVLLVLVHWYGVIALFVMTAAALAARGAPAIRQPRSVVPLVAGLAAFALCIPLAIGQRNALTIPTWVHKFAAGQLQGLASIFWLSAVPALSAATIAVVAWYSALREGAAAVRRRLDATLGDTGVAALLSLIVFPIALVALSLLGQPSMLGRYGILTALAWAPLVALACDLSGPWAARVFVVLLAVLWMTGYGRSAAQRRAFAAGVSQSVRELHIARALRLPIVYQSMHTMYAVAAADWQDRESITFLVLPDRILHNLLEVDPDVYELSKGLIVERDVVLVHNRRYGFPNVADWASLVNAPSFVLMIGDGTVPRGYTVEGFARAVFPRHQLARVTGQLTLLRMPPGSGKVPAGVQKTAGR